MQIAHAQSPRRKVRRLQAKRGQPGSMSYAKTYARAYASAYAKISRELIWYMKIIRIETVDALNRSSNCELGVGVHEESDLAFNGLRQLHVMGIVERQPVHFPGAEQTLVAPPRP